MRDKISKYVASALSLKEVELTVPKERSMGDLSLSIAMQLAKEQKRAPRHIAEELKEKILKHDNGKYFSKVEVAGAGYVNLFLNSRSVTEALAGVLDVGENFGTKKRTKPRKVLLEFVSANPTGPLHIGHARWAALGDSMANILRASGDEVVTEFYVNDVGRQVGLLVASVNAAADGHETPQDGYGGSYIKDIAIKAKQDRPDDLKSYIFKTIMDDQKDTLNRAGVSFDNWFFESSLHGKMALAKVVEKLKNAGVTYEKEGSLWFRSESFGDDKDRVLIRDSGDPTYFTADVAYHADKFDRGFDLLINIWGTDHHGYVKRIQSAMEALKYPSHKLEIVIGQLVTLYRGNEPVRMSKRTGEMITFSEVLDEIGRDALRFFLVMTGADSHMDFDLELAKSKSMENPVYYVQYAHARACNILLNAKEAGHLPDREKIGLLSEAEEKELALKLLDLPFEVNRCASSLQPHHLVRYSRELASLFHSYYHKHRVMSEDAALTGARLCLVESTRIVLANVLKLLGISAPERM